MRAIVIGGGKVGYYLIKNLLDIGCSITLIEKDYNICEKISNELDIDVICGDGSNLEDLSEAIEGTNTIIAAVTGKDEENLIICQVAKLNFDIKSAIARINNPKNRQLFNKLGIKSTVCSTEVISTLIENELVDDDFKIVKTLDRGEMVIIEAYIGKNSCWKNVDISSLTLPKDCIIASILRGNEVIYPRGYTKILEEDTVVLITNISESHTLRKFIYGDVNDGKIFGLF
ncbi:MAG: TrkA family potassium uptake protein [Clostridium sp.]|uniref:potassium channel family protein n=1 Tax=Clostridium sp. TaxID=1506 RepID=UPI00306391D5